MNPFKGHYTCTLSFKTLISLVMILRDLVFTEPYALKLLREREKRTKENTLLA